MSWYRDSDGKIITDEEFQSDCFECSVFCSEGTITIPCNGERTDCPHFKEVDTSDYDKEIRDKVIERIIERIEKARQKYQRLCREQGESEDEVMNIHFRGIVKIIKEESIR